MKLIKWYKVPLWAAEALEEHWELCRTWSHLRGGSWGIYPSTPVSHWLRSAPQGMLIPWHFWFAPILAQPALEDKAKSRFWKLAGPGLEGGEWGAQVTNFEAALTVRVVQVQGGKCEPSDQLAQEGDCWKDMREAQTVSVTGFAVRLPVFESYLRHSRTTYFTSLWLSFHICKLG